MGYEVRSHDEMIFEAETFDEFQELLEGLAEQDRNGGMNYSDLNGTAYLQTHEPSWNRLEPTAEWSRITQALKERDDLAAELERVRAERDELRSSHSLIIDQRREYEDALYVLKSRLPVNADGDVVLWGDTQLAWQEGKVVDIQVDELVPYGFGGEFLIRSDDGREAYISDCHSTAESCRAAHEKGE